MHQALGRPVRNIWGKKQALVESSQRQAVSEVSLLPTGADSLGAERSRRGGKRRVDHERVGKGGGGGGGSGWLARWEA